MGIIKHQVLGSVTGSVGHIVFKQRGETCFIFPGTKGYTTPQDIRSVSIRNQFRGISKLGHAVNKIGLLKTLWKAEFPDCYSAYHEILKANFHRFNCNDMSGTPVLTPQPGFKLPDTAINFISDYLIVNTQPLSPESGINYSIEENIITASVLIVKSNEDPEKIPEIHYRLGPETILEKDSPLFLVTDLNYGGAIVTAKRFVYKSWSLLITLDDNGNPVHYSEIIPWSSLDQNTNHNEPDSPICNLSASIPPSVSQSRLDCRP